MGQVVGFAGTHAPAAVVGFLPDAGQGDIGLVNKGVVETGIAEAEVQSVLDEHQVIDRGAGRVVRHLGHRTPCFFLGNVKDHHAKLCRDIEESIPSRKIVDPLAGKQIGAGDVGQVAGRTERLGEEINRAVLISEKEVVGI